MSTALNRRVHSLQSKVSVAAGRLNAISPLATLQRGYSILTDANGHVVTDVRELSVGDKVEATVAIGRLIARVEATRSDDSEKS
jgi:exodeoxyribonuclease VII large subunit